jgi:adenosylcobyric acid synthase
VRGALLVAGTSSDVGKSVLVAGLCRWLARQGVSVAPFKAQNISLNSFVTPGGVEIGRAQVMQAATAAIEPSADMNPVLLRPRSDRRSQVVVMGHPVAEADAVEYRALRLREFALEGESLGRLRKTCDAVLCEDADSPADEVVVDRGVLPGEADPAAHRVGLSHHVVSEHSAACFMSIPSVAIAGEIRELTGAVPAEN